jgi:hypothetical protein
MVVAPIDRDMRCVALAPGGQTLQQLGIGLGRGRMDRKLRQHRPGIGQHHADAQARARRPRADRGEPLRAALGGEGRDRAVALMPIARDPVGRQVRQPEREHP